MKVLTKAMLGVCVAIVINAVLCAGPAQAVEVNWPEPLWPEIFEPNQLLTLNIEIDANDWNRIRLDGLIWNDANQAYEPNSANPIPYSIVLPGTFWMTGEEANKIVVEVRQKSCDPLGDANDRYFKIALKLDINQYYCDPCSENCDLDPDYDPNAAPDWHGLKKLSLETGDDVDVVAEGLGCNLHRMASGPKGYGYDNWYASWVKLYVNGVYKGVYINAEQRDKQFMRNRDLYVSHDSWLYKYWGEMDFELKVGDEDFPKSPALEALCYPPFVSHSDVNLIPSGGECNFPGDANFEADMNEYVNVQGLLAMGAVDAFIANPDALLNKNGNAYFLDWNLDDPCESRKRRHFPWDVDALMGGLDWNIYDSGSDKRMYEELFLGNQTFRSQYNQIMRDLLDPNGPLSETNIYAFLNMVEPVLHDALAADPYNKFDPADPNQDPVTEHFNKIRTWISDRIVKVIEQVDNDEQTLPPGIVLLNDGFEGAVWDANWTNPGWAKDTTTYRRGSAAAHADKTNYGDLTCGDLDANGANAIHVDFWIQKNNISSYNPKLYYYNGTSYVDVCDIDAMGADDEWLHYTDTITDSNYFVSNFQIRFSASLAGGGPARDVWVDDVVVTKEAGVTISGTILDPGTAGVAGVAVDANNAGGSDSTDAAGYYELQVPHGWTGTVTPTKPRYTISSTYKSYSSVTTDQTNQDYTATSIYDLYPDGVIDELDLDVFCEDWLTPAAEADYNDDGIVDFEDFAKFVLAW